MLLSAILTFTPTTSKHTYSSYSFSLGEWISSWFFDNDKILYIKGSGNYITQDYFLEQPINEISTIGLITIVITDKKDNTISIKIDDNILPYLVVNTENQKLYIDIDAGDHYSISTNKKIKIIIPKNLITTKTLQLSRHTNVICKTIRPFSAITCYDHSSLEITENDKKAHDTFKLTLSGHAQIDLPTILANKTKITLYSHAQVNIEKLLTQTVNIYAVGHSKTNAQHITSNNTKITLSDHAQLNIASGSTKTASIDMYGHSNLNAFSFKANNIGFNPHSKHTTAKINGKKINGYKKEKRWTKKGKTFSSSSGFRLFSWKGNKKKKPKPWKDL